MHSKAAVAVIALLVLGLLPSIAAARDTNVHHGTGNATGLLVVQNATSGAFLNIELYVLTAYPFPGSGARVLGYDCLDARDPQVPAACLDVDPVTNIPAVLGDCAEVHEFNQTEGPNVIYGWQCTEGVGECTDTWSELFPSDPVGSILPEIQAMSFISPSFCSVK